jgi:hypothetical protein
MIPGQYLGIQDVEQKPSSLSSMLESTETENLLLSDNGSILMEQMRAMA